MAFYDDSSPNNLVNIGFVALQFNSKRCAGPPTTAIPTTYVSTYDSPASGQITETLRDTALGYYNTPGGNPVNQANLDALTNQFGEDYLNWRKLGFDYVFIGILDIDSSACIDVTEFDYGPDLVKSDGSIESGCKTRIYTNPWNFSYHQLGHYDYAGDCTLTADPCHYYYGPPAMCSGGSVLVLTRYRVCIEDDRLTSYYVQQDTVS